jgi:putative ABC transport system permease protein
LGRSIALNGKLCTVVGIMPKGFEHPPGAELWVPLALPANMQASSQLRILRIVGRVKPSITIPEAEKELEAISRQLQTEFAATHAGWGAKVISLRRMFDKDIRPALWSLLAAVVFLLLIACGNVANLLMARAATRHGEVAIRVALGAGHVRLLRQFGIEGLLLAILGGTLGLVLVFAGTDVLQALFPQNIANLSIPKVQRIPIDLGVLLFTSILSLATGIGFGILPVLQVPWIHINKSLKDGGRGSSTGLPVRHWRSIFIASQVALALVLLNGGGLMGRSFIQLQKGNLGFDPKNVLTMQIRLSPSRYSGQEQQRLYLRQILDQVQLLPGVRAVGTVNFLPLTGYEGYLTYNLAGLEAGRAESAYSASLRIASPDYFRALSIALLHGRYFAATDNENAPKVVLVNQTFARRHWPDGDPIDQRLILGEGTNQVSWQIVGVVADVRHYGLEKEAQAEVYFPFFQNPSSLLALTVKTATEPLSIASAVRKAIWAVDKDQPIARMLSLEQAVSESITLRRVSMQLLISFAALALLLAAVGLYAIISHSVTQRTREFGVRVALGAQRGDVLKLVFRQGMVPASIGVAIGIAGSFASTRFIESQLYGVPVTDPLIFASVSFILIGVALLACYFPARAAAQVHPMIALRCE